MAGNKVVLLPDGESTFAAMFRAIANARDHINMETFVFDDVRIEGPVVAQYQKLFIDQWQR